MKSGIVGLSAAFGIFFPCLSWAVSPADAKVVYYDLAGKSQQLDQSYGQYGLKEMSRDAGNSEINYLVRTTSGACFTYWVKSQNSAAKKGGGSRTFAEVVSSAPAPHCN